MDNVERIQESIDYIESNLSEKLQLEELAKKAYLSKFHYHRTFHAIVGMPLMEYVRKRRLTEAAKELKVSDVKIVDVALKYQFSSQEAFTRAFKKMFHVSPGEYRRAKVDIFLYKKINICSRKVAAPSATALTCMAA